MFQKPQKWLRVAWTGICRCWCSLVSAALVLLDGSGHGFGRCCLIAAVHLQQWWREWMFVDVVPIKRAALSWMVSSFLSVVGAAPTQARIIESLQCKIRPFGPLSLHRPQSPVTPCIYPSNSLALRDNVAWPINLTCISLGCGRKPENPEETHADTGKTSHSTQSPATGIKPGSLPL